MSVEVALTAYLKTVMANDAVFPGWIAPDQPDPVCTYMQLDDDISRALSGGGVITSEEYFDIHVWSSSYKTAKELARTIKAGFNSLSSPVTDWFGISLHSARTVSLQDQPREEDTKLFRVVVSIILQVKES